MKYKNTFYCYFFKCLYCVDNQCDLLFYRQNQYYYRFYLLEDDTASCTFASENKQVTTFNKEKDYEEFRNYWFKRE